MISRIITSLTHPHRMGSIESPSDFESVLKKDLAHAGCHPSPADVSARVESISPAIIGTKEVTILSDRFKCHSCYQVLHKADLIDDQCPECGDAGVLRIMCPNDHAGCTHDIVEGIAYCDICGEPVCPKCKSHDIEALSRITGYIQAVSGYNAGKAQELKDRQRYTIA